MYLFIRLGNKGATLNDYQKLAGKLQHALFGIPGGAGLFSPLQEAMLGDLPFITLIDMLKEILKDSWRYMVHLGFATLHCLPALCWLQRRMRAWLWQRVV